MSNVIQPFHFLVIALTGWINRRQQTVIGEGEPKDSVDQDTVLRIFGTHNRAKPNAKAAALFRDKQVRPGVV